MAEQAEQVDVVIVGAGLAGLACARALRRSGLEVRLYEAGDGVGGRVRSDVVEGFRLDRGFQVMLPAYPEARRVLHYESLNLRPLYRGTLVFWQGAFHRLVDPLVHPLRAVESLFDSLSSWRDRWKTLLLMKDTLCHQEVVRDGKKEVETEDYLRSIGFSDGFIDRFFRPFFGGVFLEKDLRTSARMFRYLFSMFNSKGAAVPANGMQAIPDQLAASLPEGSIHLNQPVASVGPGRVRLESGEEIRAREVVLATSEKVANRLLGELGDADADVRTRSVSCLYFVADTAPTARGVLCLDGDGRGPVNNLCVMSKVAPEYAPAGRHLISASVLGTPKGEELEQEVRNQMAEWFGDQVRQWKLLRTYQIEDAQPESVQMHIGDKPPEVRIQPGLLRCGDYCNDVSINGALLSGRRAAEAILAEGKAAL